MKRIIFTTTIFSLVFVLGGVALAQYQGQDQNQGPFQGRGLNPELRSNLEQGPNALRLGRLGKPLQGNQGQETGDISENPNHFIAPTGESGTGQVREKILHPGEIKYFEQIKKIGKSLFGMRKKEFPKPMFIKPEFVQCIKTAITKRVTSLKAAMSDHNQKILTLLDARTACELAALDKTTAQEQFDANKLCITADQKSMKENEGTFEKAREDAQKTFRDDVRSCVGVQPENTSHESENNDNNHPGGQGNNANNNSNSNTNTSQ